MEAVVWLQGMLARPSLIYPLIATFVTDQIGAFALLLGIVAADESTGRQSLRRAAYVAAVVFAAAISAPLESVFGVMFVEPVFAWMDVVKGTLYTFFEWMALGGAATFIYTDRRRAHAATARLRAAELARAQTAKRTLESRLQAMQARVEPRFLFDTLGQVKTLCRTDGAAGERMLSELIAYLRAAMPKMRETTSTLAQEMELARAYLAIVKVRLADRLDFSIDAPDELGGTRMPSMMLLPLVSHAVSRCEAPVGHDVAYRRNHRPWSTSPDDRKRSRCVRP